MILDSSAVIAILLAEKEKNIFVKHLLLSETPLVMCAPNYLEASMVLTKYFSEDAIGILLDFIKAYSIAILPFSFELASIAQQAFLKFGKGRHPASLNFGDCAAYALAKEKDWPLLYKGNDFSQTDINKVETLL